MYHILRYDWVQVKGKANEAFISIGDYSGSIAPDKIRTIYPEVLVIFSSDHQKEAQGFNISIDFLLNGRFS